MSKLDPKLLKIGILGYTGETGKALTSEVLKQDIFKEVVLIGRRIVDFKEEIYKKAIQKVVDFEKLQEYEDTFKELDVVYCCLGTTRGKSGVSGFRRVDFDYTLESAKLSKQSGCKQFHLVSSMGANVNAYFLYPKTKGEIEAAVAALNFENCAIYRPAMLMCDREESRPMERLARILIRPLQYLAPTLATTPVDIMAKSMINNTLLESKPMHQIIENAEIFELAGEKNKKK